jgi:Bacterial mobilisation protein (MobC)
MGRPRQQDRRDKQLNLHLTTAEMAWVRARAQSFGMRPPEFARAQLLTDRPLPTSRGISHGGLDPLFLAQLSRIGNNLNQIARRFNAHRTPAPRELAPLLELVRSLLMRAAGP